MRDRVTEAARMTAFRARHALTGRTNHAAPAAGFERVPARAPRLPGERFNVTFRRVPARHHVAAH